MKLAMMTSSILVKPFTVMIKLVRTPRKLRRGQHAKHNFRKTLKVGDKSSNAGNEKQRKKRGKA